MLRVKILLDRQNHSKESTTKFVRQTWSCAMKINFAGRTEAPCGRLKQWLYD
jgi:hypothetical protein